MTGEEKESLQVILPVRRSAITSSGSGIARIHVSHMDMFEKDNSPMAVISNQKKRVVVKMVSDEMASRKCVTLRSKDMDDLDVSEDEEVIIEPYTRLSEDLKESWNRFKARFKKEDDEEEGEN